MKPTTPDCKAFLVCDQTTVQDGQTILAGFPLVTINQFYPAGQNLVIFARLASAHGTYQLAVQLRAPDGEIVWRHALPEPTLMDDPIHYYDLTLAVTIVFPKPDEFDIVLLANNEVVGRQRFRAMLASELADPLKP